MLYAYWMAVLSILDSKERGIIFGNHVVDPGAAEWLRKAV